MYVILLLRYITGWRRPFCGRVAPSTAPKPIDKTKNSTATHGGHHKLRSNRDDAVRVSPEDSIDAELFSKVLKNAKRVHPT